jgi:hypothetical protein
VAFRIVSVTLAAAVIFACAGFRAAPAAEARSLTEAENAALEEIRSYLANYYGNAGDPRVNEIVSYAREQMLEIDDENDWNAGDGNPSQPPMEPGSELEQIKENAEKSLRLAAALFPEETWVYKEPNIYVAESRLSEEYREKEKWEREMSQVRILTSRGSTAYFLPEQEKKGETGKRSADLVLDGVVMEMKTVAGTRVTLGGEFRLAYKQGAAIARRNAGLPIHSVFIRLKTDLPVISVMSKAAGELKERLDGGSFICYFERSGELHTWTYEELRSIISKNNPAFWGPGVGR